ncbi:MAG: MTH1187 family thiamine-binding protein [Firmicutes bacterium]|nr:MTH1187 family thiamine-binding protein [Bacillota bacterium]
MAIVEVKIVPIGTDSASMSSYVASCYRLVQDEGLKHQLTPTSTIIEGELNQVLDVVRKMHEVPFDNGADRVVTNIYIDERKDRSSDMGDMVDAVESGV